MVLEEELTKKINGEMFQIWLAAGTYFKNQKNKTNSSTAKDTRLSGYTLEPALVSGLASAATFIHLDPCQQMVLQC